MSAPAFTLPSTALVSAMAQGKHIPGGTLMRDALADPEAWAVQAEGERTKETDPQIAEEQSALIGHLAAAAECSPAR